MPDQPDALPLDLAAEPDAAAPKPPAEFPLYDLDIPTDYRCPYCRYEWSGKAK